MFILLITTIFLHFMLISRLSLAQVNSLILINIMNL